MFRRTKPNGTLKLLAIRSRSKMLLKFLSISSSTLKLKIISRFKKPILKAKLLSNKSKVMLNQTRLNLDKIHEVQKDLKSKMMNQTKALKECLKLKKLEKSAISTN